ncbi:MAG: DMT family transporter [Paracoccaceae bacterium]
MAETPPQRTASPVFRAIAFKLTSVMLFVSMSALIKSLAGQVPPGEVVFFRSAFAAPVILIWLIFTGRMADGLRTSNYQGHFFRGLMGTAAMGCGFAGLGLLPLPEVTAIGYAAPLLTVVFAAMFLGERVRIFRILSVALGMAGVLIILSPRLHIDMGAVGTAEALGAVLVLVGAVFAALAQVFVRKLVAEERTSAIVFYFSINSAALSLITLPFGWVMPDPATFVTLATCGLLGGIGQVFLTSSYRYADASVVAPFDYASMLVALAVGYFAFDEVPSTTVLAGAALVIVAGIVIIWRERLLGLERGAGRRATTPQ